MLLLLNITRQDLPILITSIAALAGILSYFINRSNARKIVSNEILKKQSEAVSKLIDKINESRFEIVFTRFKDSGSGGSLFKANLFEAPTLNITQFDGEYFENPLIFSKNSNQLFDFNPFLNNSQLPTSIADKLETFYTRHSSKLTHSDLDGQLVIVINSKYYEPTEWDKGIVDGFTAWSSNAFAMVNYYNFIECCINLQNSISDWLRKNNIPDINFNKYQTYR